MGANRIVYEQDTSILLHYILYFSVTDCLELRNAISIYCISTGRSLYCQVENHVRTKFATPILYAIDNFKIYEFFSTYTQPLIISFVYIF